MTNREKTMFGVASLMVTISFGIGFLTGSDAGHRRGYIQGAVDAHTGKARVRPVESVKQWDVFNGEKMLGGRTEREERP